MGQMKQVPWVCKNSPEDIESKASFIKSTVSKLQQEQIGADNYCIMDHS